MSKYLLMTRLSTMLETVGWLGGILLAACALPQAIKSYHQKHSFGLSIWFLYMWLGGEVLVLAYVLPKWHWPLIFNYTANILLVIVILYYKLWPGVTWAAGSDKSYTH